MIKKVAAKKKKIAGPKISKVSKGPQKLDTKGLALLAAEAAFDKKAFDVVVMDVSGKSPVTDMMVIASARSTTHMRAVSDNVEKELQKHNVKTMHRDRGIGGDTDWILLDYFDVMVHVFVNDIRAHYQLERLYKDAKIIAEFH